MNRNEDSHHKISDFSDKEVRIGYFYDNEEDFEYIADFLINNQHIYYVSKNELPGKDYYEIDDFYIYYDYLSTGDEFEIVGNIDEFVEYIKKVNLDNINGTYCFDDELLTYDTSRIFEYYMYLKLDAKKNDAIVGYYLCVDDSCVSKDDYFEYSRDEQEYFESTKINEHWMSVYSTLSN